MRSPLALLLFAGLLSSCQASPPDALVSCLQARLGGGAAEKIVYWSPLPQCRSEGAILRVPLRDERLEQVEARTAPMNPAGRVNCLLLTPGYYSTVYVMPQRCSGPNDLRQARFIVPNNLRIDYRFSDHSIDYRIVTCRLSRGLVVHTSRSSCLYEGGSIEP